MKFAFNARVWEDKLGRKWVGIQEDPSNRYPNGKVFYIPAVSLEDIQADEKVLEVTVKEDVFVFDRSNDG